MKKTHGHLLFFFMLSVFLCHCARYPAIPELEGDRPSEIQKSTEEQQTEARMRDLLGSLKTNQSKEYVIGIKDVVSIDVWEQPEFTRTVSVSQDGTISLPLLGSIRAEGRSVSEMEKEITDRLSGRYLINPQVTVSVVQYQSKSVSVLGEVGGKGGRGVGKYPLRGKTTLLEVLTEAGFSEEAGSECIVIRPGEKKDTAGAGTSRNNDGEVIRIDIPQLMKGDRLLNIELQDGDTIYIPKAQIYFVIGEVRQPGNYKFQQGVTVLKAIATAGGLTEKAASMKRVKILREEDGQKRRIAANPTDLLKPQDTVIVPESFF